MEIDKKKIALLDKFQQDPLWEHIKLLGLDEKVFQNDTFLRQVVFEVDYTTSQVTTMLGLKTNQQILNLLNRHDLKDYIRLMQSENGYYSFNHIGIFQLHMILFLREEGMQPLEIATLVGTVAQYSKGRQLKRESFNEKSLSTQELLKNNLIDMLDDFKMEQMIELKKKDIINQLAIWEVEARSIRSQLQRVKDNIDMLDKQPEVKVGVFAKLLGLHKGEADSTLNTLRKALDNDKKQLEEREASLTKDIEVLLGEHKEWISSNEDDRFSLKENLNTVLKIKNNKGTESYEISNRE